MRCIRSGVVFLAICFAAALEVWPSVASGDISGVVTDPRGDALPGSIVQIRNADSRSAASVVADDQGRFSFKTVAAGTYEVSAQSQGFANAIRKEIRVAADRETVVNFSMNIRPTDIVVVVTAPSMIRPLVVETDPRLPRQPLPANDGADYLKAIPGFSIVRKGGTDGDPSFRGMAGSRLNILLDGQHILGGCGGRMDPPTAYVFPEVYDRVTVLKGPQSVVHGPGSSAATVLFERTRRRAERGLIASDGAAAVGSYGRHDEMIDMRAAMPNLYLQGTATRSHAGDYRDGAGNAVHSSYTRWSAGAELGWTPAEDTYVALSFARSNAQAAYADRAMDGTEFARDNMAIKFEKRNLTSLVERVEAQWYYNYVDHVMDNFTLRAPGAAFNINNPDRRTKGGRIAATLGLGTRATVIAGFDMQQNVHRLRNIAGAKSATLAATAFQTGARVEDMRFTQIGFFGEGTHTLTKGHRLIGGVRVDRHRGTDSRTCVNAATCPGASPLSNDTRGLEDRRTLVSGFGRYEWDLHAGSTLYAGVGHAERAPDYWERLKQDPSTLKSSFLSTRSEKTTQLDIGWVRRSALWSASVSGFYGKIADYILMRWQPGPVLTRNVDATTMGGEADVAFNATSHITVDAALSYVRSNNDTDRKPLAQQPPLETRIGLNYHNDAYSFGALARLAGAQDRVDIGSGSIVANGMDVGRTPGFAVFSIHGGYRVRNALITAGVDNLLNRNYVEHLSKSAAMIMGFPQTGRIHEPGRTFWLKINFDSERR